MSNTITTTTGIKQDVLDKFNLDTESVAERLDAEVLDEAPDKKDLTPGVYVLETEQGVSVYTTELDTWATDFAELDAKAQEACKKDGFNRQHVNKPAHEAVKSGLGIKEASAKTKAVDEEKTRILSVMVAQGIEVEKIYKTFPDIPQDVIDRAIEANQK